VISILASLFWNTAFAIRNKMLHIFKCNQIIKKFPELQRASNPRFPMTMYNHIKSKSRYNRPYVVVRIRVELC